MLYVEAPIEWSGKPQGAGVFLAGGISGCPDWQSWMKFRLAGTSLALLNPRRATFDMSDPQGAEKQIKWERDHLRRADAIMFWFPCETLCPIVLYELGAWSMTDKPIFVGCHPEYQRREDVRVQTALVRPGVTVVYSLEELAVQVEKFQEADA